MKTLFLAAAVIVTLGLAGPATAADLAVAPPVKAPPPVMVPLL
jgi:hypothetical protein